ncbi:DUF2079 domain-containing protein [Kitasatospora sp. HPMI-4]|uniref:DUF2079 domain-containing protein n=1 Tax=Kitasatospora sp. HPMI-4 TaxID=3448443 RepID=UPI003F1B7464
METDGFDLGIFEEAVRGYAGLGGPLVALKGVDYNLLGDHFSPVLALLAPVYRVFPGAITLLLAQAALLAVSALPVTKLAMSTVGRWGGLAVGLAYGLSWGLWDALAFDFHEVAFAVPLAAFAVEALASGKARAAAGWALPLLLVKEDQGLLVIGIGVYLFAALGKRRLGMGLTVVALLTMALAILVFIPLANPEGKYTYADTGAWTGGDPFTRLLLPGAKWQTLAALLAPTLLLALRSPLCLLLALPLAARFWSLNPTFWGMGQHYNAVLMPVIFLALIDGLRRMTRPAETAAVPPISAVATQSRSVRIRPAVRRKLDTGLGLVPTGVLVAAVAMLPVPSFAPPGGQAEAAKRTLAVIPDGASVAAANSLAPQLTDRCTVSLFPYLTPPGQTAPWIRPTAYWVATLARPGDFPFPEAQMTRFKDALPSLGYRQVAEGGGVAVYRWVGH